jgi:hypothetical protein
VPKGRKHLLMINESPEYNVEEIRGNQIASGA